MHSQISVVTITANELEQMLQAAAELGAKRAIEANQADRLLTVKQAAEELGASENTVRSMIAEGILPYVPVGIGGQDKRVRRSDLFNPKNQNAQDPNTVRLAALATRKRRGPQPGQRAADT